MAFRIKPGEALPHAIRRMARAELADARDVVTAPRRSVDERVHDVRTAIKKVRALIRMVKPEAPRRRIRRADRRLKNVADAVSGARDAEVVLTTFDGVVRAMHESPGGSLAQARTRLDARLRASAGPMRRHRTTKKLYARLARARQTVERWIPNEDRWCAVGPGLTDGYRRARDAMAAARRSDSGVDYHAWRRAAKTHRHQVHALVPVAPRKLKPRVDALDCLGDLLGEEHDLTVLEETIRGEQACFPDERHCDHLLHLIAQRRLRLRDRARPMGEKLFGERPSDFRDWLHADFRAFRRRTAGR